VTILGRAGHRRRNAADLVRSVAVVVPARNEQALIGRCLDGLAVACARLLSRRPDISIAIVVVLDACTDASALVVARHPDVTALEIDAANVGVARRAGLRLLRERLSGTSAGASGADLRALWVANTDADSVVPASWLVEQVALAEGGHDVVVGLVAPDQAEMPRELLRRWRSRQRLEDGHDHVHGANLGFRLTTYVEAGGFEPLPVHEDVRLVERMRARQARVAATHRAPVLTSARTVGRAPAGFAAYLDELSASGPALEGA
jgi:glycosyltransferase involved in cell wall biosynthesis